MRGPHDRWQRHVLLATLGGMVALQGIDRVLFARMPAASLGGWVGGGEGAFREPVLFAFGADVAVITLLVLVGGFLVPRQLPLGVTRPAVAFLAGASLQIVLGLLLLPPRVALPLLLLSTAAVHRVLSHRGLHGGWRREDIPAGMVAVGLTALTAWTIRDQGVVRLSNDSFEYWEGARLLAAGALRPEDLESKRMLALQALHAPGIALGTDGTMTLGPMLLVSAVVLLGASAGLIARARGLRASALQHVVAFAVAATVAASSWLWFNATYLNVHLLVATLLLALGLLTTLARMLGDLRPVMPTLMVLTAALTLSRAESALLLGGLLVGTLLDRTTWRDWAPIWRILGVTLLAWNVLLVAGTEPGAPVGLAPVVGSLAGIVALVTPRLLALMPAGARALLPVILATVLWAGVVLLPETPIGDGIVFAEMARVNLGEGAGGWSLTAPLLLLLGAFGVAGTAGVVSTAPVRWFLILFIPLTVVAKLVDGTDALGVGSAADAIDVLLSGGGRPKWGDSVNRMWTHATLLVVALITLSPDRPALSPRRPGRRPLVASVGLVMSVAIVTAWWRPDLGPDGPPRVTVLVDTSPVRPGLELVAGANDSRTIPLPTATTVPADARFVATCFDVVLEAPATTPAQGTFELAITAGGRIAREEFRGAAQADGAVKEVCLELLAPYPDEATAAIRGTSGESGRVVTVLATAGAGFVRSSTLTVDAPSLDPRSPLARAGSWTVRRLIQWGPTALGLGLSLVVLLPHRQRQGPRGVSPDR